MRNIAIGILMVILLSVLVEPLVEIANVMREKVILGSALSNACRAAKTRSLKYEMQRDRDAVVDEVLFRDYFSQAFESAMNCTEASSAGNIITFESNDDKYNTFTVTVDIIDKNDLYTGQRITEVHVKAESIYKFKTKYLRLADIAYDADYELTGERMLLLQVIN